MSKSTAKKLSNQWKVGFQGILDAYLGQCPEKFTFEGKEYTPKIEDIQPSENARLVQGDTEALLGVR